MFNDFLCMFVGFYDSLEVSEQCDAETPYTQPEKDAQGKDYAREQVHPPLVERLVGGSEDFRIFVESVENVYVPAVGQTLNDAFHVFVEFANAIILGNGEEQAQITGGEWQIVAFYE